MPKSKKRNPAQPMPDARPGVDAPIALSARVGAYPSSALSLLQDAEGMTFGEALTLYQDLITPTKKGRREERAVIGVVRRFALHMLDLPLPAIRPKHIATYRNVRRQNPSVRTYRNGLKALARPPSDTTIRKELCLISDVFGKAQLEWGLETMVNPVVTGIRPKASRGRVRRMTDEERALIFSAATAYERRTQSTVPIRAAIELAVETAMRLGELASIRWDDVDFDRGYVQLLTTKNGDARAVPLKPRAMEI
ncbi:MAG: tyrosine-type recombinase/integrase, partial [Pseudomonadota bacterium]|nr:tyrosine-type recombinase/integrase [Pseudomonadota bacterium]